MKITKKVKLIGIPLIAAALVTLAITVALTNQSGKKTPVAQQNSQQQSLDNELAEPAQLDQPDAAVQEESPQPAPPDPEQPKHGEDQSNPGFYKVFDTTWAMNESGIVSDQQAPAAELIAKLSGNWVYRQTADAESVSAKNRNLCRAYPITKMSIIAADYETNPVTQLKWCAKYVSERYGNWQNALNNFNAGNGF